MLRQDIGSIPLLAAMQNIDGTLHRRAVTHGERNESASEKAGLVQASGLSRKQVNTWFSILEREGEISLIQ